MNTGLGILNTPQIEPLEPRSLLSGEWIAQTITVRVYFDHNSDLRRNKSEAGIPGIRVTAKGLRNEAGVRISGTGITGSGGVLRFTTYVDSFSSNPASASISLSPVDQYRCLNYAPNSKNVSSATASPAAEFGMVDFMTITGRVGYAYRTSADSNAGLPSRTVFDDMNNNGRRDSGEPADDTDLSGQYSLKLKAGSHRLKVITSSIWKAAAGSVLTQSYALKPGRYLAPADMTPVLSSPVTITLLAAYTTGADSFLFDSEEKSMPDYIEGMVYTANKVFANSDTNVRISLVGTASTSYVETGNISTDLTRLHEEGDNKLDDILVARDNLDADLVTLITAPDFGDVGPSDDDDTIGLGYQFSRGFDSDTLGFTVVRLDNTNEDGMTLAHELGHNLGAGHDPDHVDEDILTAPYAHGYRFRGADNELYQDIMAYGSGTELPFFSTPRFKYAGKLLGNAASADNARLIREIAPEVARYR